MAARGPSTGLHRTGAEAKKYTAAHVEGVFTGTRLARSADTSIPTSITNACTINGVATAVCTLRAVVLHASITAHHDRPQAPAVPPQAVSSSQVLVQVTDPVPLAL